MKKKFTLKDKLFLIFSLFAFAISAQVGINVQTPYNNSGLHIKGDPTNASSGDELVIDNAGRIGIGTVTPKAKFEINRNGTNSPMRIVDGKVAVNKIMSSDSNGYIKWSDMPTTGGQNYYLTGTSSASYTNGTYSFLYKIPISTTGFYYMLLRWWGITNSFNVNNSTSAAFYITVSNTTSDTWANNQSYVVDSAEEYIVGKSGNSTSSIDRMICFTKNFSAEATAGSYLRIFLRVTTGGPWIIRGINTTQTAWIPSIVMFRI